MKKTQRKEIQEKTITELLADGRNIRQHNGAIAGQAIKSSWYVAGSSSRDIDLRSLQSGNNIVPLARCSFNDQHMGRSLYIHECRRFAEPITAAAARSSA